MSKFDLFANFLQKEYNIDIKKAGLVPPRPGLKWNPVVHRWVSEETGRPPQNKMRRFMERMRLAKQIKKSIIGLTPKPFKAPKLTPQNTGASFKNLSAKLPGVKSPSFPKAYSSFVGRQSALKNKAIGQSQAFNKK